jgi:hypothetical protein
MFASSLHAASLFFCKGERSVRIQVLMLIALLSLFAVTAVAADIGGNWTSEAAGRDGTPQVTKYAFTVSGTTLTGKITSNRGGQDVVQDISEGKIAGDEVSFVTVRDTPNGSMKTNFKGKVAGAEIRLTREMVMPAGGGAPGGGAPGGGGGAGAGRGAGGGGRGPTEIVLKRAS